MTKREPVVCKDGLCSFNSTGKNYYPQHWYHCETCFPLYPNKGCCDACAAVCHKGHQLEEGKTQYFYCDCGAGDCKIRCKCLSKPKPILQSDKRIDEEKKVVTQRINKIIDDLFISPFPEPPVPEIPIPTPVNDIINDSNQKETIEIHKTQEILKEESIEDLDPFHIESSNSILKESNNLITDNCLSDSIDNIEPIQPEIHPKKNFSNTTPVIIKLNKPSNARNLLPHPQSQSQCMELKRTRDSDKNNTMRTPHISRPATKMKRIVRKKPQTKARFNLYV